MDSGIFTNIYSIPNDKIEIYAKRETKKKLNIMIIIFIIIYCSYFMFTGLYTVYVYVPSSFFTVESPNVPTSVPSEENAKTVSTPISSGNVFML